MSAQGGRLSTFAAAMVVARRDFAAILYSRSFIFFLLGPLFPVIVGALAGGLGHRMETSGEPPALRVAMAPADSAAMLRARAALAPQIDEALPPMVAAAAEGERQHRNIGAVLSGTPARPRLSGPEAQIEAWRGPVALVAATALHGLPGPVPEVSLHATASSVASDRRGRMATAQGAQTLLFLLTMVLAGMVLSNLVEEKANKVIEVLAAAIPMDAVFLGKLFAMLGVSFVGIAAWASVAGLAIAGVGQGLPMLAAPAVGWPAMIALGIAYFAMAYLLLGSVFLAIGSLASTVREVQTLSMPVTMMQLVVFFLASYAMTQPGSGAEIFALAFPFSSPFAMLARAAQEPALWPHAVALAWEALWVAILIRAGSRLFRRRVMQSGPAPARKRRHPAQEVS